MPTSRPNRGGESNLGKHNQSSEPSDETSAAVWVSPMRPYSAIDGTGADVTRSRYPMEACSTRRSGA